MCNSGTCALPQRGFGEAFLPAQRLSSALDPLGTKPPKAFSGVQRGTLEKIKKIMGKIIYQNWERSQKINFSHNANEKIKAVHGMQRKKKISDQLVFLKVQ